MIINQFSNPGSKTTTSPWLPRSRFLSKAKPIFYNIMCRGASHVLSVIHKMLAHHGQNSNGRIKRLNFTKIVLRMLSRYILQTMKIYWSNTHSCWCWNGLKRMDKSFCGKMLVLAGICKIPEPTKRAMRPLKKLFR